MISNSILPHMTEEQRAWLKKYQELQQTDEAKENLRQFRQQMGRVQLPSPPTKPAMDGDKVIDSSFDQDKTADTPSHTDVRRCATMTGNVGGWDKYIANFLKAVDVESENDKFVVTKVEEVESDEGPKIQLELSNAKGAFLFDLNKTNAVFLKNTGITQPRLAIGKGIYFKKVNVTSPKTKQVVEGLRIYKVE